MNQNASNSPAYLQDQVEKDLKNAIFDAEKPLNSSDIGDKQGIKPAENRRFSFNSEGKAKTLFKISSVNSEKKDRPQNINDKEKEECSSDIEKNSQHEEISYEENLDEIICPNNKDCSNKEAKFSVSKIFTTTVVEKGKKAINFKVIKNRERYNSSNTVNSVNFNSNASYNNSNNNTACNINVNINPLNSISNPLASNVNENNYNNNNENIINNNFPSDVNFNHYINSNSTSSNSVVVNNLSSISNLNVNCNINLNNNNSKINFNNNSINTDNSNSNSNQLNNNMDDLNLYDKNPSQCKTKPNIQIKPTAKAPVNDSNNAYFNSKENLNSLSENNALIENNNNFMINNNLNNPNMKNSKNNTNPGKQQVFDLNSIATQNGYMNGQSSYNHNLKNIQNPTQSANSANINSQLQFFGNENHQEFFNDSNPQTLNSNSNLVNQNIRSCAQQNYTVYQPQNFSYYEKENLAASAAQNFNNFNDYFPNAENFGGKRNKENEENLNFNSLYLSSANFGNGVAIRQQAHNMYSNHIQQNYLNPYNHQFSANLPNGVPGINSALPGNAVGMGMIGVSSHGRNPLRCKENYIDELLGMFYDKIFLFFYLF